MSATPEGTQPRRISLQWLLNVRWVVLGAYAVGAALAAGALHIAVPWMELGVVGAVAAGSNLVGALWLRRREIPATPLVVLVALDLVLLTVVLALTGGLYNPFVAGYVVIAVLAGSLFGRRGMLAAVASAAVAVLVLALAARPLTIDHSHADGRPGAHAHARIDGGGAHFRLHTEGTWVAFVLLGVFVVYVLDWALRRREAQIVALTSENRRARELAELGALAAQAAHELGTPLSTIAVAARELERGLESGDVGSLEDVRAIRAQVERCRTVLDELARRARGETEPARRFDIRELLSEARSLAPDPPRVHLEDVPAPAAAAGPRTAILHVVRGLIENAQRASPDSTTTIRAQLVDGGCRIDVVDAGQGLPSGAELGRAPRPSRAGMGMGLFLSRAIVERIGGHLELQARERGCTASLLLPTEEVA